MDGYVTIGTELDTKEFDSQITYIEGRMLEIEHKLKEADMGFEIGDTQKLEAEYEKLGNQLVSLKQKQDKYNQSIRESSSIGLSNIQSQLSGIGAGIDNVVHKVLRWGLAVFGVRSAYLFVRSAANELSQSNEQIGADIDYIRFALATALQPVIEGLIKIVYKLLVYTAYIAKAWFGVNLFAKASSKAFEDANNKVKKTNKSAKELQKTIAGFDEMNILQENGSVSTGGGGGGIKAPSIDLSDWENVEIPGWVKWIAKNKDLILGTLAAIAAGIAAIKIAKFIKNLISLISSISDVTKSMKLLKTAGIALMIAGFIALIKNVADLILNWDKLTTKQKALKIAMAALGAAAITLGYAIATGISAATLGIGALIAVITTAITVVGALIVKMLNEKDAIKSVEEAEKSLEAQKKKTKDAYNSYINAVDSAIEAHNNLIKIQNETGLSGKELYDQVQNGTLTYKEMNATQKEVYKAYLADIQAQENEVKASEKYQKQVSKTTLKQWELKMATEAQNDEFKDGSKAAKKFRDDVVNAWEKGELSADEAQTLISKAMSNMSLSAQKTFTKNLPSYIKSGLQPELYEGTWNNFLRFWNAKTNSILKGNASMMAGLSGGGGGGGHFAKGGIVYHNLPKLASGGIINQPGRGVPIASAIGGERGAEGVIPLTDSQQMALLGQQIGRYITINANIINEMNGKVISRELQKVQNDSDFAYNR